MAERNVRFGDAAWASAQGRLAADVRRVADRLRILSDARLAAPVPPHGSRATAAREAAQALADATQGVEDRHQAGEPLWRELPLLGDLAVGDQVAVTGQDLLTVMADVAPDQPVWARGSRRTAQESLTTAATHLGELRAIL